MAYSFMGEHEHNLDERGRIAIPAKFRSKLGEAVVITRGFDRCLLVYPIEVWQAISDKMATVSVANDDGRESLRFLFSRASDVEIDKQGRILIPASLRDYANIRDTVILIGMNTRFEIWDKATWEEVRARLDSNGPAIAQRIDQMGVQI